MPCDYTKYPVNWKTEIVPRILARAGEKRDAEGKIIQEATCEWPGCTAKNHEFGMRDTAGEFHEWGEPFFDANEYPQGARLFPIILTVAHVEHDLSKNEDKDLAAWCQFHHLKHDAKQHARTIKENREKRDRQRALEWEEP